ncbi:hypothetical protein R1sor_012656 [Riccia sorocarpa]|uniref:Uncharacterized protein n=1 Tax=Riccia sorocarpa TaxID=122646 RepID=A0ABD3I4E1_9MARC
MWDDVSTRHHVCWCLGLVYTLTMPGYNRVARLDRKTLDELYSLRDEYEGLAYDEPELFTVGSRYTEILLEIETEIMTRIEANWRTLWEVDEEPPAGPNWDGGPNSNKVQMPGFNPILGYLAKGSVEEMLGLIKEIVQYLKHHEPSVPILSLYNDLMNGLWEEIDSREPEETQLEHLEDDQSSVGSTN